MKETRIKKVYRARTAVAVNIRYGNSRTLRHVRFMPLSEGGSVMITADAALQKGLEQHPRCGTLFKLDPQSEKPQEGQG